MKPRLSAADEARIVSLRDNQGLPFATIAQRYGVGPNTIQRAYERGREAAGMPVTELPPEDRRAMRRYVE